MKKSLSFPGRAGSRLDRETAERIAIEALGFLAADQGRLTRFFDITGLDVASVRTAATRPDFLANVLDYIGSEEALLRAFAAESHYDPAHVDAARMRLAPRVED